MTSIADEIDRLAAQRDAGRLTEAEFESAKARVLGQSSGTAWTVPSGDGRAEVQRLRRSLNDRWLGGVCGGLAVLTGMESWLVRLIFTLAVLFAGIGLIPYVLLWIFIPPEDR